MYVLNCTRKFLLGRTYWIYSVVISLFALDINIFCRLISLILFSLFLSLHSLSLSLPICFSIIVYAENIYLHLFISLLRNIQYHFTFWSDKNFWMAFCACFVRLCVCHFWRLFMIMRCPNNHNHNLKCNDIFFYSFLFFFCLFNFCLRKCIVCYTMKKAPKTIIIIHLYQSIGIDYYYFQIDICIYL